MKRGFACYRSAFDLVNLFNVTNREPQITLVYGDFNDTFSADYCAMNHFLWVPAPGVLLLFSLVIYKSLIDL